MRKGKDMGKGCARVRVEHSIKRGKYEMREVSMGKGG